MRTFAVLTISVELGYPYVITDQSVIYLETLCLVPT